MKAYRCDRCGKFDDGEPVATVTMRPKETPNAAREYELCPRCLAWQRDFLDGAPLRDEP